MTINSEKSFRIILVDDEATVLFALKLLMQACGHEVTDFNHPQEAIDFFLSNSSEIAQSIDLIVCDLKMPKKSGLMVLADAQSLIPSVPFILMSAHATREEQEQAAALGCAGFLAKPFSPAQLNDLIGSLKLAEAV